jgi:hypothetical protein
MESQTKDWDSNVPAGRCVDGQWSMAERGQRQVQRKSEGRGLAIGHRRKEIRTGAVLPRDMRRFLKAPENSTEVISRLVPYGLGALGALHVAAASDMVVYGPMAADFGYCPILKLRHSG